MSETGYLDQIRQLVELQKIDDNIFEERCGLENTPKDLEDVRKRFLETEKKRNLVLDKLAHLNEQKKRLSFEIEDDSARIKKSKNKMMNVGNSREYQAMIREMDNMEKSTRTREEERVTLLEEIQRQEDALAAIDSIYADLKQDMEAREASLEETMAACADRLEVLDRQRQNASAGIPKPIFRRYEFIRNRLEHPVIVACENSICSGCNIAIPPQTFIELQTGKQILSCPNCQRLIYWNEHFESPEDIKAKKARLAASKAEAGGERESAGKALQDVWPEDALKGGSDLMQPEFEQGLPSRQGRGDNEEDPPAGEEE